MAALLAVAAAGGACGSSTAQQPDAAIDAGTRPDLDGPPQPVRTATLAAGGVTSAALPALAAAFGADGQGSAGGPCLSEPAPGALVPRNFNRLRFEWIAPAGDNVFELRVRATDGSAPAWQVVYTDRPSFTLDAAWWREVTRDGTVHELAIAIRSAHLDGGVVTSGPRLGSSGTVHIAPVDASGAIIYWTTTGGSALKGFHIGDDSAVTVLDPGTIRSATPGDDTKCVGCHASIPGTGAVLLTRSAQPTGGPFSLDARSTDGSGARPSGTAVSRTALDPLRRSQQLMPTLAQSPADPAGPFVVSLLDADFTHHFELAWTNLGRGTTGIVRRGGDSGQPDAPTLSRDGRTIAYVSSDGALAIDVARARTDLYTVPFASGAGGNAMPVSGASDPRYNEFYPVYSPDDTFLAFNRIPANGVVYNAPSAEVFVVPAHGGDAVRSEGNDPPACTGITSPGIGNSWPRWAPGAGSDGGRRYYWLVFSSRRHVGADGSRLPQLYLSGVTSTTVNNVETIERTWPAVYIPTQSPSEANHTPAWDDVEIPPPG